MVDSLTSAAESLKDSVWYDKISGRSGIIISNREGNKGLILMWVIKSNQIRFNKLVIDESRDPAQIVVDIYLYIVY